MATKDKMIDYDPTDGETPLYMEERDGFWLGDCDSNYVGGIRVNWNRLPYNNIDKETPIFIEVQEIDPENRSYIPKRDAMMCFTREQMIILRDCLNMMLKRIDIE